VQIKKKLVLEHFRMFIFDFELVIRAGPREKRLMEGKSGERQSRAMYVRWSGAEVSQDMA